MRTTTLVGLLLIGLACWLAFNPPGPGPQPTPAPAPAVKASAVTFVFEKDQHVVPPPVIAALNKLNRERGIIATIYDKDTVDGQGEIPEQYKAARAAALEAGLPALVVLHGKVVIRVVKNPTTEAQILEAVP